MYSTSTHLEHIRLRTPKLPHRASNPDGLLATIIHNDDLGAIADLHAIIHVKSGPCSQTDPY